jgi:hypothetical protein
VPPVVVATALELVPPVVEAVLVAEAVPDVPPVELVALADDEVASPEEPPPLLLDSSPLLELETDEELLVPDVDSPEEPLLPFDELRVDPVVELGVHAAPQLAKSAAAPNIPTRFVLCIVCSLQLGGRSLNEAPPSAT